MEMRWIKPTGHVDLGKLFSHVSIGWMHLHRQWEINGHGQSDIGEENLSANFFRRSTSQKNSKAKGYLTSLLLPLNCGSSAVVVMDGYASIAFASAKVRENRANY